MSEIPTTTTTTTIPCVDKYTTVTLAEGESYVLPPGAVLVGATDPSLLTSLNDCLDLDNLEEFECYVCPIPIGAEDGDDSQYWEPTIGTNSETNITGYTLSGISYNFSTSYESASIGNFINTTNLLNELKAVLPITFATYASVSDVNRGTLNYFVIKTIPSIAKSLYLTIKVKAPVSWENDANAYFKFVPIADLAGYTNVPSCPTT